MAASMKFVVLVLALFMLAHSLLRTRCKADDVSPAYHDHNPVPHSQKESRYQEFSSDHGVKTGQRCVNKKNFRLVVKSKVTCEELSQLADRAVSLACEAKSVRRRCCQTCAAIGDAADSADCTDNSNSKVMLDMGLSCQEYTDWRAESMKKMCANSEKSVSNNCCKSCQKLTSSSGQDCPQLLLCPKGLTKKAPCTSKAMKYESISNIEFTTNSIIVTFLSETLKQYAGDVCAVVQFSGATGVEVHEIQLKFRQFYPITLETKEIGSVENNIPDKEQKISLPEKVAGNQLQLLLIYKGSKAMRWDFKPAKMTRLELHGCLCSELPE